MLQIKTYETLNREDLEKDINYTLTALGDAVVDIAFSSSSNGAFFAVVVYKETPDDNFIK